METSVRIMSEEDPVNNSPLDGNPDDGNASQTHVRSLNFDLLPSKTEELSIGADEQGKIEGLLSPKNVIDCVSVDTLEELKLPVDSETFQTDLPNQIIYFVNKDAKVSPYPVLQYVLDIDQPFDTVISCADGRIGAHRLVLASASPFIGDLFSSNDHRLGEVAVVVLPDVRVSTMKTLLNFCYTGSMYFPKEDEEEVFATMRLLLLGEYGDLTLKEVVVKQQAPQPSTSLNSSTMDPLRPQEQSVLEEIAASTSNNDEDRKDLVLAEDELFSSSSSDEEDECKSGDDLKPGIKREDNHEKQSSPHKGHSLAKKENISNGPGIKPQLHHYTIAPLQPGAKARKLQCCHCPGAFKSIDTLSTHMDNNHGIFLHSRKLEKAEQKALLYCDICKTRHSQISSANQCLSKHSRTRCYFCLEVVRHKKFEAHIKSAHSVNMRNGMCVVKCRWCDAGLVFREPVDNKLAAGHCYAQHFPGGRGSSVNHSEISSTPSNKEKQLQESTPVQSTTVKTEPATAGSSQKAKAIPAVLALLQKASQKRKTLPKPSMESECSQTEIPKKKRIKLDENGKRLQVARRTGKPVGRLVNLSELVDGVPSYRTKGKTKSVTIDVTKLHETFVRFQYSKHFITDNYMQANQQDVVNEQLQGTPNPASSSNHFKVAKYSGCASNGFYEYRCALPYL